MKILRSLILINTAFLALLGLWIAFGRPEPFPVSFPAGKPYEVTATLRFLGTALGGSALVLFAASSLSLVGDRRQLAFWLSAANGLVAMMALIQQTAIWGSPLGWLLVLVHAGFAAALAWAGTLPLSPAEVTAEVAALQIPGEIRQALLQQIGEVAAQEERNRLARDLHDSIKQQLFSVNVSAAAAQARWESDPEEARAAVADIRRSAQEAMAEMRALLLQLRPQALAGTGLVEALREQCEALGYRTGSEVALELGDPIPDDRLPPGAPETLFRIAQEALANVARHARARQVRVRLGRERDVAVLRVEDDGQGFDASAEGSGMGLRNLRERTASLQGRLEVDSAPGRGTRIAVLVPLMPPKKEETPEEVRREAWSSVQAFVTPNFILLGLRATLSEPETIRLVNSQVLPWMLATAVVVTWLRTWLQARRKRSPEGAFTRERERALNGLCSLWWFWGLASFPPQGSNGLVLIVTALLVTGLAAFAAFQLYRSSEVRPYWKDPASRSWMEATVVVLAATTLATAVSVFTPHLLPLRPVEIGLLFYTGPAFAWVASRRLPSGASR